MAIAEEIHVVTGLHGFLHAALWVAGMVLHAVIRYTEWKKSTKESNTAYLTEFIFRRDFMAAQVLSLLLLVYWLSDISVAGFKFSDYVPHHFIVSFVLGYFSDSLLKHVLQKIPFLTKLTGDKNTRGGDASS